MADRQGQDLFVILEQQAFAVQIAEKRVESRDRQGMEPLLNLGSGSDPLTVQIDLAGAPIQAMMEGRAVDAFLADDQELAAIPIAQGRLVGLGPVAVKFMPGRDPVGDGTPELSLTAAAAAVIHHQCADILSDFGRHKSAIPAFRGQAGNAEGAGGATDR